MPRQPTATKTSHEKWSHIFSVSIMIIPTRLLCQMQTNSSGAKFLSTISKLIKRKKIMSLMFTFFTKREIRHFHVVVVQWRLRNVQKAWCTCKIVVFSCQAIPFFTFSSPLLFYDTLWSVRNRIFSVQVELLLMIASETFFDSLIVSSFLVRKAW